MYAIFALCSLFLVLVCFLTLSEDLGVNFTICNPFVTIPESLRSSVVRIDIYIHSSKLTPTICRD